VVRRAGGEVRLTASRRIGMEAKIQQPQLYVDYPSPANFAPGDRELDVLANVLGNGKASRLYKRLVYDLKIAQAVTAQQQSQLLASTFEITASPMPGHTVDEILAIIDEEVAKLQATPPDPAELERAKNQIESETVRSLEPILARAERLQSYNYLLGDPGFITEDLRRYRAVDAAAIQRYAREVLDKTNRVVVAVDPNPEAPIMGRVKK
jgi:predicted Zn-dependent peptidase